MLLAILPPPEPAPPWEMVPVPAAYRNCPVSAEWGNPVSDSGPVRRASNTVSFVDGALQWNGVPISETILRQYVDAASRITPRPVMIVHAHGMSCEKLQAVTAVIEAEAKCSPDLCVVDFPYSSQNETFAPAPPAPPPPPRIAKVLRPISPGSWVTNDDYPAEAIREGQQGTTSFRLDVDEKGTVTKCTVTSSSGSQILDDATCTLLMARAKFGHAEDWQGHPIPAVYSNRFRWELPQPDPRPMVSWTDTLRISIGSAGDVISCAPQHFGPVPEWVMPGCDWLISASRDELRNVRGSATGLVTLVLRSEHRVSGVEPPAAPALSAAFKPIWRMNYRVEVQPDGHPAACYVDWGHGETAVPADKCAAEGLFESGTEWHTMTTKNVVLTDGDPNVGEALNKLTVHLRAR